MFEPEKVVKTMKLKEFLPYRLSVLSNRISRSITERYEDKFKLSAAEWRTIAILGEESDLSAAEVAERTAMDKVAISRAVNNLISNDRLERHFSEDDKRRSVLALSENGRKIYEQIVPLALSYETSLLDELNEEEQVFLDSILSKLSEIQASQ
ncbi:MAG: DNA-binding MarR family transcriptional regulator [Enterobacterales bacterium]|jgi:DNA-binding MarR family transcriptional regulator